MGRGILQSFPVLGRAQGLAELFQTPFVLHGTFTKMLRRFQPDQGIAHERGARGIRRDIHGHGRPWFRRTPLALSLASVHAISQLLLPAIAFQVSIELLPIVFIPQSPT
jgi:hypothetical protein